MIVSAPAKINLTLEVLAVEPNGYHILDTIFAWLQLEDSLQLKAAEETSLSIISDGVNLQSIEADERNLVLRAHRAMEKAVNKVLPTSFTLTKRIPAGGGLGGGSADASATLFGLNQLYQLRLSPDQLLELARPLGADVSFGLVGGLARGRHYGDELESLTWPRHLLGRELVLVLPRFACSTPEVYALWDREPSQAAQGASERFLAAKTVEDSLREIANDLEEPAFRLQPQLRSLKEEMLSAGLEGVSLSGSGSTLFGFLPPELDYETVKAALTTSEVEVLASKLKESTRFGLVS